MTRADQDLLTFKQAKMSNKTIAMLLGWTEARVERRLGELTMLATESHEEAAHDQDPAPPAPDAQTPAAEKEGAPDPVEVVAAAPVAICSSDVAEDRIEMAIEGWPSGLPAPPAYLEQDQVRLSTRALIAVSAIDFGRLAQPVQRRRLKAVTPNIRRWAACFLDARWSLEVVAGLFGVDADDLDQALRTAA